MRIGIIFGGRSGEHEVSLRSAKSIINAVDPERYEIIPILVTPRGEWVIPADLMAALQPGAGDSAGGRRVALLPAPDWAGLLVLDQPDAANANRPTLIKLDVIFPVIHGTFGEDGTLQGLLELANLPFVGPGVLASAVGMDKVIMKDLFVRHGLPVVSYCPQRIGSWRRDPEQVLNEIEQICGYPLFVKPANLGSSVGVHQCRDRDELRQGLADAFRYDRKVIAEAAVPEPREIEVSVLGNESPTASVPGEIVPSRSFYDYQAKYLDDGSRLLIPAPVTPAAAEELRRLAIAAYKAIDCEGMARVDFLVNRRSGQIYVNEVNTIPGFTEISMYPKLWAASGLPYPQLLDRLIELAFERWRERQALRTSYVAGGSHEQGLPVLPHCRGGTAHRQSL